jgi:hypothetical protein
MRSLPENRYEISASEQTILLAEYRAGLVGSSLRSVKTAHRVDALKRNRFAQAILKMAAAIEPDPAESLGWYRTTPIMPMGQKTAQEMVAVGRAEEVMHFLLMIRNECVVDRESSS